MTLRLTQCSNMFPMLCLPLGPTWREAVAKRCQAAACYRHDSSFHVHQRASIWNPSGSLWAQPQPNMTQWHQLGLPHRHLGPIGPLWEQPGAKLSPTRANSADSMQHAESVHFIAISNVFWGSCEAMLPTLGLSWAQLRRQMPPHRTKLRMRAKLSHVGPQLGPSWSQLARVRHKFKLGASELLFGPT